MSREDLFSVFGLHENTALKILKLNIGFAASLIFSLAAYFNIRDLEFFHLSIHPAIFIILIFALFQAMARSIFFLYVLSEKGPRWDLLIFTSTITVVVIIVSLSIWIMNHQNYNMMGYTGSA